MSAKKLKINDRVKRSNMQGCLGTVKDVRTEVVASSGNSKDRDKAPMVQVLWDNGTLSYLGPDALEVV